MSIVLRLARSEDCDFVFALRNSPPVRATSWDTSVLDYGAHTCWYEQAICSADRMVCIGEWNGRRVGVVRLDLHESEAQVSIFLSEDAVGRGLGQQLLTKAEELARLRWDHLTRLRAEVLEGNLRSCRFFERSKYMRTASIYQKDLDR